jgi:hypothetical protein
MKQEFYELMEKKLGKDFADFKYSLLEPPQLSIRLNPEKKPNLYFKLNPIPWSSRGFYLEQERAY